MAEMFGFLIIGYFIGGITMAVVYGIVDKYDNSEKPNSQDHIANVSKMVGQN
jgi:hypothetical protein